VKHTLKSKAFFFFSFVAFLCRLLTLFPSSHPILNKQKKNRYLWYTRIFLLPKFDYNGLHPYYSFIPIIYYILVRNLMPEWRKCESLLTLARPRRALAGVVCVGVSVSVSVGVGVGVSVSVSVSVSVGVIKEGMGRFTFHKYEFVGHLPHTHTI
jgi:hypothetical protein